MSTPCTHCKDSILNKTPTLIGSPLCNGDCPEEYVCLDITPAGCVSIQGKEDCITNGDTVQEQIDIIREYICNTPNSCDCPPNMYTINSVCIDEVTGSFILNITPLFSYLYPLTILPSISSPPLNVYQNMYYGAVSTNLQSVTINTPINIPLVLLGDPQIGSEDIVKFQITDNKGNYSAPYIINFGNISIC